MDEVSRTADVYEDDAAAFIEKYRAESVAERFGDEFYAHLRGERILDVGCGPGIDTETFVDGGFDVVAFDLTRPFIEAAQASVPDASFVQGDMRHLPFAENTFDGVWSCASFLHIPTADATDTLREFRRILDDDGVVYLSVYRGEESGYHTDGRYFERYLPDEVRSLVAGVGFDSIALQDDQTWLKVVAQV
ncbi:class I SAM-dependent methyltransferase [Haloferax sp. DFSO60]|uniref:class I SAM-dependent methyltransferase n=1 Tax=Haloferax sp. DFSO60 TaxID=3388652 RepID=UPI00397AA247